MFHIGKKIRQVIKDQGMPVQDFAHAIDRSRTVVYDIFERETIDTGLLITISEVLGYDFFRLYSPRVVNKSVAHDNDDSTTKSTERIEALEKEVSYLKEINDLLRKQSAQNSVGQ